MKIEHNHEQDDLNNKTITPYFDVRRRNFGHWDIWDAHGRIFAIRGGPGRYYVRDSRNEDKRKETFYAKTVGMCMGYICEELMFEVLVAGGQENQNHRTLEHLMSIKSTKNVTRKFAIARITVMLGLFYTKSYRKIEAATAEDHHLRLKQFVDTFETVDISGIGEWTNSMLEEILDKPFIRESMFDNYHVVEDG